MFIGLISSALKIVVENDFFTLICDSQRKARSGPLFFWYYIFCLSKVYEFLDTVILVLKKRDPIFLHVWHHCTTLLLCYVSLVTDVSIQIVSIATNCMVHIPMYFYYFISSLGVKDIWWKKYITTIQIIQFVVTLSINCFWFYAFFFFDEPCVGEIFSFAFGMVVITSFLVLFIQFYRSNYKEDENNKKKKND